MNITLTPHSSNGDKCNVALYQGTTSQAAEKLHGKELCNKRTALAGP